MANIKNHWIVVDDPRFTRAVIESLNIPCEDIALELPGVGQFFAFPAEYLPVLLKSFLGQEESNFKLKEVKTNVPGIGLVTIEAIAKAVANAPLPKVIKWDKACKAFVEGSRAKFAQAIDETRKRLAGIEAESEKLTAQLIEKLREHQEKAVLLESMTNPGSKDKYKTLEEEFGRITTSKKFTNFDARNGWFIVDTADIKHQETGNIGRFRIELKVTGNPQEIFGNHHGVSTVKISRIGVAKNDRVHPHENAQYAVHNPSGSGFCLGTVVEPLVKALRECEYGFALDLVLRYLEEG